MKAERYEDGPLRYMIRGIESDMGEGTTIKDLVRRFPEDDVPG